jgi:hypothetical protein
MTPGRRCWAVPSQAREDVSTAVTCAAAEAQETRKARWWRRTTACAHDTSGCDQTKAVLHTAIEAASGRPPRSATHFTAQSRVIVPISSSLACADSKLGISQRLAYMQGLPRRRTVEACWWLLCSHREPPLLSISWSSVLMAMLCLSSKPDARHTADDERSTPASKATRAEITRASVTVT